MSERTLKLLGVVVGTLAALYVMVTVLGGRMGNAGPAPAGALEEALGALDPASLESVDVQGPGGERIALRGSGEGPWTVNGLRADFDAVVRLREALEAAETGPPVATNPDNHARLGVAGDSAWRASLHADGESVTLLLGEGGPSYGASYARLADADEVFLLEGGLVAALKRSLSEWRDRTIVSVDTAEVSTLLLERDGVLLTLVRSGGGWRTGGGEGPAADSAAVAAVLQELSELEAVGFPAAGAQDLDSAGTGEDAEEAGDALRRVVALGSTGDTLAALELRSAPLSRWRVRTAADTLAYELMGYVVDRLVPADSVLTGRWGGVLCVVAVTRGAGLRSPTAGGYPDRASHRTQSRGTTTPAKGTSGGAQFAPGGGMAAPVPATRTQESELPAAVSRELFPELRGGPLDLDSHAPSVVQRALNEGSEELVARLVDHYGTARFAELARARSHRLTDGAYARWGGRLRLPPRTAAASAAHRLWRT